MIIFLTTPGHEYTVTSMGNKDYAQNMPEMRILTYTQALYAEELPCATYIFTDIERLYSWEQRCAADLYRALTETGLRCLNNPARVMTRYELLRALCRAGLNPFNVYRADDDPRPARFPVFIRLEDGHGSPLSPLLDDQCALSAELARLQTEGWALRLMLVIEFCAEPIAEGVWRKHGCFIVGKDIHLNHNVIENNWVVKYGTVGIWTEAMFQDESEAIAERRFSESIRPAFELAGIEYGRADHATVNGREVVYEINTNPFVGRNHAQASAVRDAAFIRAAEFMASAMVKIDCPESGNIRLERGLHLPGRLHHPEFPIKRP